MLAFASLRSHGSVLSDVLGWPLPLLSALKVTDGPCDLSTAVGGGGGGAVPIIEPFRLPNLYPNNGLAGYAKLNTATVWGPISYIVKARQPPPLPPWGKKRSFMP